MAAETAWIFVIIVFMQKAISTEQTPENIQQVLTLLANIPHCLQACANSLSLEQLTQPLGPSERTPTEVLAHILHCEALTAESIYLALMLKEPLLHKVHAERDIGNLLRLDQYTFEELLNYFTFRRKVLMNILASLNEKQWARTLREKGKKRQESVYWRARSQALHELEHLEDIESKLA